MSSKDEDFLAVLQSYYADGDISLHEFEQMKSYLTDNLFLPTPGDSVVWKNTGNVFFKRKDYSNALKCYESAVEIDNGNTAALYNIAQTYRIIGRNEDARKIFEYLNKNKPAGEEIREPETPVIPPPGYYSVPGNSQTRENKGRDNAPGATPTMYGSMKSPVLALILSFFFGGLGQVYNGRLGKGIAIFIGEALGFLLVVPGFIVWIYSLYDAYKTSQRMNLGKIPFKRGSLWDYVVYFVVVIVFMIIAVFVFISVVSPLILPQSHAVSTTGQHQFANPGFETGTLADWTAGSTTSVMSGKAHTGTYSAHFDMSGTPATDYAGQYLDLTGASNITFWGLGEGNNWPFYVYVDKTLVAKPNSVSNTWTKYSIPISGQSGNHVVLVMWNGGPGKYGADIDDFSVT